MSAKIIIDFILTAVGGYLIFTSINMKKSGQIPSLFVNEEELPHCRDRAGYIAYMYQKTLLFGIVALIAGIVCLINDAVYQLGTTINVLAVLVFLGSFLWLTKAMQTARARFF